MAVDEGFLGRNPAGKLEVPKAQKSRARFYSLVEVHAFLSVSTAFTAERGQQFSEFLSQPQAEP